jgi:serine protease Do
MSRYSQILTRVLRLAIVAIVLLDIGTSVGDIEKIVSCSKRDGNDAIYVTDTDSSNQVNITDKPSRHLPAVRDESKDVRSDNGLESVSKPVQDSQLTSIERCLRVLYETVGPAVVRIVAGEDKDHEWHFASGVIVTADGYVVTRSSSRTIHEGAPMAFYLADGRHVMGTVLGWSEEWRIGLMKLNEKGPWPYAKLGKRSDIKSGQLCVALGYPLARGVGHGRQPALYLGCVTRSAVPVWFASSCTVRHFGSGVFDLEGRLLGVTARIPGDGEPEHTSVGLIRKHWDDLAAGKNLDHVRLLSSEKTAGKSPPTIGEETPPAAEKDRFSAAVKKAKLATVRIRLADDKRWSGVIVTADGYILTCAHTGQLPGDKVTISLPGGRDVAGKVLGVSRISDIGLVKINEKGPWPYVELGKSTTMEPDDPCLLMGYPVTHRDRQPLIRRGRIVEREDYSWSCLLFTSSSDQRYTGSYAGASGGGVFDLKGRVVAVLHGLESSGAGRHGRVEMFRQQWDFLAAGKPVDVPSSEPLDKISAAFHHLATDLGPIVVEVLGDNKQRALGTIVRSDGRILTKASELEGVLSCRFSDGQTLSATVEKVLREHDLAVLKVDANNLPEADLSSSEKVVTGSLIAALTPEKRPLVGVVSHSARPIAPEPDWLGVPVWDGDHGLEIGDDSTARKFNVPLREGDIIVEVEGQRTPDLKAYLETLQRKAGIPIGYAGDPIRVAVKRGDDTLEFRFPLPPVPYARGYGQSDRCSAFPNVFDAHILLTPKMCGSPVIDKTGHVAGTAIACGDRGWTYVIPATVAGNLVPD